jgi:hypothetical protein
MTIQQQKFFFHVVPYVKQIISQTITLSLSLSLYLSLSIFCQNTNSDKQSNKQSKSSSFAHVERFESDGNKLKERGLAVQRNLYDSSTGLMRPKSRNGHVIIKPSFMMMMF